MDVDAIEPGADFPAVIAREVASCDVLIALIGPTWSTITDRHGGRRLDDSDDFVVLEIRTALECEKHVIPVLIDGADMPDRNYLPEGLQDLAWRNAVRLDHETFRSDSATLLDAVEQILSTLAQKAAEPTVMTGTRAADQAIDGELLDEAPETDNLWLQFAKRWNVADVRAAYQQAIDSGDADQAPRAALNLGSLLVEKDIASAQAAYQRAIDSNHAEWAPRAALNLGSLLVEKDIAGAQAAYQEAIDSGHAKWAPKAAAILRLAHKRWWRPFEPR